MTYASIVVAKIRSACATEFDKPAEFPFFSADYREGEAADEALFRLFAAEKATGVHASDDAVICALIYG